MSLLTWARKPTGIFVASLSCTQQAWLANTSTGRANGLARTPRSDYHANMQCPKCEGVLTPQDYSDDISVHRCTECCGILLEPQMLERIRAQVRADEFFDIGHTKVGKVLNPIREYACPSCQAPMQAASDPRQVHVRFETCTVCGMLFLDAGELIDLSHETIMDKLLDIVVQVTGRH